MKESSLLFFLFAITITSLFAQITEAGGEEHADIAAKERRAYQRLRDVFETRSIDSFSVASENFDVHHYRCEWQIDPAVRFIQGKVTVSFSVKTPSDNIVLDLSAHLMVDSVVYHGSTTIFERRSNDGLLIRFPGTLQKGIKDSVIIYYQGIPDPLRTGAFYQGVYRGLPSVWTLSEPYGSKQWWPCKNGLTDKADSIDIIVICPDVNTSSSNGVVHSEILARGQRITHFKHRYPIASYLVAIAISQYNIERDSVQIGNRQMPVLTYAYSWSAPDYFKPAVKVSKLCLQKFSDLFGIYPFYKEQYCQTQWGVNGGMEHQTNSFIIDGRPELVSHELGHQWFGNKVTCGSWQDIWLNEGFATYTTNIYYEHFDTTQLRPTLQRLINSITSQPGGSVWVADTTSSSRLFSARLTYNKGAYVVHMLRWVLGDSVFFKGVRRYLDNGAVTYSFARTSDLRKVLEEESGKNLEAFFQEWVYGEGYPDYHAEWSQNNNNWIKVKLNQTTSHTSVGFYEMPVMITAKSGSRESTFVVDHRYSGQEFWLNAGYAVDSLIIDPKLWILSKNKTSSKINGNIIPNEVKIYPNPAPGELKISLKNPSDKKLSIQLLNVLGQVLYQKEIQTAGNDELIHVPLTGLQKGIYLLKLQSERSIKYTQQILHD